MATRQGARLAGLVSCRNPHQRLRQLYCYIGRYLQKYPEESNYRKNTEKIIEYRNSILEETQCLRHVESLIGCGRIELIIQQAERELHLAKKLLPYRPWESLVSVPPENQWKWPVIKC